MPSGTYETENKKPGVERSKERSSVELVGNKDVLADFIKGEPGTAIFIAGGGFNGRLTAPILEVLNEQGVFDKQPGRIPIFGQSAGALNAALLVTGGISEAKDLYKKVADSGWIKGIKDFKPDIRLNPRVLVDIASKYVGGLRGKLPDSKFDATVVVTEAESMTPRYVNLNTGEVTQIEANGSIKKEETKASPVKAIFASMWLPNLLASPGLHISDLSPENGAAKIAEERFVDGGLSDYFPFKAMEKLIDRSQASFEDGPKRIVVFNNYPDGEWSTPPPLVNRLVQSISGFFYAQGKQFGDNYYEKMFDSAYTEYSKTLREIHTGKFNGIDIVMICPAKISSPIRIGSNGFEKDWQQKKIDAKELFDKLSA